MSGREGFNSRVNAVYQKIKPYPNDRAVYFTDKTYLFLYRTADGSGWIISEAIDCGDEETVAYVEDTAENPEEITNVWNVLEGDDVFKPDEKMNVVCEVCGAAIFGRMAEVDTLVNIHFAPRGLDDNKHEYYWGSKNSNIVYLYRDALGTRWSIGPSVGPASVYAYVDDSAEYAYNITGVWMIAVSGAFEEDLNVRVECYTGLDGCSEHEQCGTAGFCVQDIFGDTACSQPCGFCLDAIAIRGVCPPCNEPFCRRHGDCSATYYCSKCGKCIELDFCTEGDSIDGICEPHCTSHEHCPITEYCHPLSHCVYPCSLCKAVMDDCPDCFECFSHSGCNEGLEYCDDHSACYSCYACDTWRDSIDGECPECKDVNPDETAALLELYRVTDGPNWSHPWDFKELLCFQEGVTCNENSGQVTSLLLQNNNLQGHIPSLLGALTALELLHLGGNLLEGEIPEALGNIRSLIFLSLGNNKLSGTVPLPVLNLGAIEVDLSSNKLTGNILNSLARSTAPSLSLFLSDNRFTGTIPSAIFFLRFEGLYAGNNELEGTLPPNFCDVEGLSYNLNFGNNMLNGTIPNCSPQAEFNQIILSNNQLEGELSTISNVVHMDLACNSLTGTIPEAYCSPPLRFLNVSNNNLEGSIPTCVMYESSDLLTMDAFQNSKMYGPELPDNTLRYDSTKIVDFAGMNMSCFSIVPTETRGLIQVYIPPQYYNFLNCFCYDSLYWNMTSDEDPNTGKCVQCNTDAMTCDSTVQRAVRNHQLLPGKYAISPEDHSIIHSGDELIGALLFDCYPEDLCQISASGEFQCREGHSGFLCSRCESGYFPRGEFCSHCSNISRYIIPIVDVAIFTALLLYLWFSALKTEDNAMLQITVFYLQLMSVLRVTGMYAPEEDDSGFEFLESVYQLFGVEHLVSLSPLAFECLFEFSHVAIFWTILGVPVGALVLVLFLFAVQTVIQMGIYFCLSILKKDEEPEAEEHPPESKNKEKWKFVYFFILDLAFFPTVSIIFSTFNCVSPQPEFSYLLAAASISCDSAVYKPMFVFCFIGIFYLLLLYVFFGTSIYRAYKHDDMESVAHLSFIWNNQQPGKYWWRIILTPLRKIAIAIYLLLPRNSIYGPVIVFSTVLVTLLIQLRQNPYSHHSDNSVEIFTIVIAIIIYQVAILSSIGDAVFTDSSIWLIIQTVDFLVKVFLVVFMVYAFVSNRRKKANKNINKNSDPEPDVHPDSEALISPASE